jgi:hypothetical protein
LLVYSLLSYACLLSAIKHRRSEKEREIERERERERTSDVSEVSTLHAGVIGRLIGGYKVAGSHLNIDITPLFVKRSI